MHRLFLILLAPLFLLLLVGKVTAAGTSSCQIIYGGGEVCPPGVNFTIDKKVLSPTKGGGYVENIGASDTKFSPGQNVTFQITVKNTGNAKITGMQVVDTLPEFLTFVSGDGKWDAASRRITMSNITLDPGKSRTFTFVAKIADGSVFRSNEAVVCLINEVRATDSTGGNAMDTAQVCVQRSVPSELPQPQVMKGGPISETPPTGPEMLGLAALIPAGTFGYYLRKKSQSMTNQKGGGEI